MKSGFVVRVELLTMVVATTKIELGERNVLPAFVYTLTMNMYFKLSG